MIRPRSIQSLLFSIFNSYWLTDSYSKKVIQRFTNTISAVQYIVLFEPSELRLVPPLSAFPPRSDGNLVMNVCKNS